MCGEWSLCSRNMKSLYELNQRKMVEFLCRVSNKYWQNPNYDYLFPLRIPYLFSYKLISLKDIENISSNHDLSSWHFIRNLETENRDAPNTTPWVMKNSPCFQFAGANTRGGFADVPGLIRSSMRSSKSVETRANLFRETYSQTNYPIDGWYRESRTAS